MNPVFLLLSAATLFISACEKKTTANSGIHEIADAIGCNITNRLNTSDLIDLENLDRAFYNPIKVQSVPMRLKEPIKAYSGPSIGGWYFTIEDYKTAREATDRVDGYHDLSRIAEKSGEDSNMVSKYTVRCWALAEDSRVFMLTTPASAWFNMEREKSYILNPLKELIAENTVNSAE